MPFALTNLINLTSFNFVGSNLCENLAPAIQEWMQSVANVVESGCDNTAISEVGEFPGSFALYANYPNPFNPTTRIRFDVAAAGTVNLTIYDVVGKVVGIPVDRWLGAGSYEVWWEADLLPTGPYIYRLTAGEETASRMMMLLK